MNQSVIMRGRGFISRKSWRYLPIATQKPIKVQLQPIIATWVDVLKLATRYLDQCEEFIFLALEMGHGLDPFQEVGASRGTHRTTRPHPSTLHGYLPTLWC
jgi:hypothetical protein